MLIHSLYGSKFQLSAEMFRILAAFLPGCAVEHQDATDPSSDAIQDLIEEKVLIGEREFSELGGEALFQGRLRPLELAFQREFNEGGYFPGTVDASQAPAPMKRVRGLKSIALRKHSDFPEVRSVRLSGIAALHSQLCPAADREAQAGAIPAVDGPGPRARRAPRVWHHLVAQLPERRSSVSSRSLPVGGECSIAPQGDLLLPPL